MVLKVNNNSIEFLRCCLSNFINLYFVLFVKDDDHPMTPNGEVVQDETSSCFMDNKSNKENTPTIGGLKPTNLFSILSSHGHGGDSSPTNKLGRSYSSYNGDKDDMNHAQILKPGVPQLFHSASFDDKITNTSNSGSQNHTRIPTVIKLAVKRTDLEDPNGTRMYKTLETFQIFSYDA